MTGSDVQIHSAGRAPGDDPWVLAYAGFDPAREGLREALCALGNGRFLTRGAASETAADGVHYPGTYVAGGYNALSSDVAGREVLNEDLVNFPNWLPLTFRPEDGDWLKPDDVELLAYRLELRMREGVLWRSLRFRDRQGRETAVETRRLVHMAIPHLAAIEYRITPENWGGDVRIRSGIDGGVVNSGVARYRQLASRHLELLASGPMAPEGVHLLVRTSQSHLEVGLAARNRVLLDGERTTVERQMGGEGTDRVEEEMRTAIEAGRTLTMEKVVGLHTSRDRGIASAGSDARRAVACAPDFGELLRTHILAWEAIWRRHDIEMEGEANTIGPSTQERMILRLHLFHLLQTVSPNTVGLDVGVPARGLHGEAYRGHVFWDEIFILPLLNLRAPSIARSLLLYRYHRLSAARELARAAGYDGAMYPWQSGSDGREATQELHLNPRSGRWDPDHSRLQRHVNAGVVYNIWQYYRATGDRAFMVEYGAEVVLEIARFWSSLATHDATTGRYGITGVMGPDEYHEKYPDTEAGGLRNNAYTNVMSVWCLLRALDVLAVIGAERAAELTAALKIGERELARWREITERMSIPFLGEGVIAQFEGYGDLEPFDWEGYRARYGDIERLDRILKAEGDTPDGYQVSKQADVMMLFHLLDPAELNAIFERLGYPLPEDATTRNVRYYKSRTSHGSTLSKTVFASVVHHIDCDTGCALFLEALRSDFGDVQGGTTPEGIHLGAMAGTVGIVLRRYAGVTLTEGGVRFAPDLPARIGSLRFRLAVRGRWLDVELTKGRLRAGLAVDAYAAVRVHAGAAWHQIEPGGALDLEL